MSISIRLDPATEAALRRRLLADQRSLSDFVREAIQEKLRVDEPETPTPWSIGEPLFGRYSSGEGDRSQRRKELLKERLDAKHRR